MLPKKQWKSPSRQELLIPIDLLSNKNLDHQPNPAFSDETALMDKEI